MRIESFNLKPGDRLNGHYEIIDLLGDGWEGEVYLVKELATGIERAAKFFYPQHNPHGRTTRFYAKKLHKLRECDLVIQYSTQEETFLNGQLVAYVISEYIEGEMLSEYLGRQPGKRLQPFEALHLLHALASGMEAVHRLKEYHGDLHTNNIMVQHVGLRYELKVIDLLKLGSTRAQSIREDVLDMIKVFHEILGGQKHYAKLPKEIKAIICGLKESLIFKKFRTAGQLREYLEHMQWD